MRLRKLFDAGYIDRPQPQRELASRRGTAAIVYALGPRGAAYLGEPVKRNHEVGSFFLRHVLLVSRVYTTMAQACARTGVHLTQWVNEYPLPVLELPGIREAPHLKADAFFILAYRNSYATFFLEVDRGTEPGQRADLEKQSSLLRKIVYYQELFRRREEFGVRNLRVLALVPSERRLEHYLDLARGADPEGKGLGVFWGTTHDQLPQEEPGRLFSADIWHTPTRGPLPLLP